jgi:uncharacterized protein (DUF1501 family)
MLMTRRFFLKTTGAFAAYCGVAPFDAFSQHEAAAISNASAVRKGKTLVAVFLRGGLDGLNLVVPFGEKHYYDLRKSIAIPQPGQKDGALDLDGFFGLHPAAEDLMPLFQSGEAVAIQAVGYDKNTRSHFEEQDVWETGVIGNTVNSDGWLNRHLLTSEGHGPIRAIAIGNNLPRILRGDAPAYAVRGISDLTMPPGHVKETAIAAALEHAYCSDPAGHISNAREMLAQTAGATLEGIRRLRDLAKEEYKPSAEYPKTGIASQFKEAARLIKADVGLEVVEIDYGGWDTHNGQGGSRGQYQRRLQDLAQALAAFRKDLGGRMNDTLVLTLSDFGRTAAENGSGGTDHGWANCVLAIGGPVLAAGNGKARKVLGKWPGLAPEQLHQERDLLHTTDFRDVLAEAVRVHLGNSNIEKVLPAHQFKPVGILS